MGGQNRGDPMADDHVHWERSEPSAVEILRRGHDLVAFGWCQETDARDSEQRPAKPWSAEACSWSLLGALVAALGAPGGTGAERPELIAQLRVALVALSQEISDWSLQAWNDDPQRTQAEVLEVLQASHRRCGEMLQRSGPEA